MGAGESFDHMFLDSDGKLFSEEFLTNLDRMLESLKDLPDNYDYYQEALHFRMLISSSLARANAAKIRLNGIFRAVEYYHSSDSSMSDVLIEIKKYREVKSETTPGTILIDIQEALKLHRIGAINSELLLHLTSIFSQRLEEFKKNE